MCHRQLPHYDSESDPNDLNRPFSPRLTTLEPLPRPLPGAGVPATDQLISLTANPRRSVWAPSHVVPTLRRSDWAFADAVENTQRSYDSPVVSPRTTTTAAVTSNLDARRAHTPPEMLDFLIKTDLEHPDKAPWLPGGLLDEEEGFVCPANQLNSEIILLQHQDLARRRAAKPPTPSMNAWPPASLTPVFAKSLPEACTSGLNNEGGVRGAPDDQRTPTHQFLLPPPLNFGGTMYYGQLQQQITRQPDETPPITPVPGQTLALLRCPRPEQSQEQSIRLPSLREKLDEPTDLEPSQSEPLRNSAQILDQSSLSLELPVRGRATQESTYRDALVLGSRLNDRTKDLSVEKGGEAID